MFVAYSEHGFFEESMKLFSKMRRKDVFPSKSTFCVLLSVNVELFSTTYRGLLHSLAEKTGLIKYKNVEDTLIYMYLRTRYITAVEEVFFSMTYCDIVTWNMMICGYCLHGFGYESLDLFHEMLELGKILIV
ncbi:unnamed protein product [Lactuca virosa]|uniref:Pentatricopeptide repeat-containing protein n=1 Tax=Lactuca virosa TaxID=75947 RepID=A0AAU9LKB4_9ASTR|nr:unnamed protein product [Lactuca virosa]